MYRIAFVVVVVAACSKGKPDDCAIVRDKPASAMAELSKRYPNNPVKVAQTIEACVAPTGDECDRIAKIVAAIPTMTPQITMPKTTFDAAAACRASPPEFRRCLLPSYNLAHQDECRDAMTKAVTSLEIKPSDKPARTGTDDDCGFVAIYVSQEGTWLATGRDDKSRCFAPRTGKALDDRWLETQLRKAKAHPCSPSSAEIAAAEDVPYQDMIRAMDIAVKTGFMDTGVSSPSGLAVPLATASEKGAASECPATVITADAKAKPDAQPAQPPGSLPSGPDRLASAPVLIVSKDKLTLKVNDKSTDIATIAEARAASKLDALTKALPKTRDGMMILQADESTPTKVINLIVETAKASGYDNLLFAVKNR
jgi:biopolymer transport protein ExbD